MTPFTFGHILDMAEKARALVRHKSRADYDRDEVLRLALAHLVQVIGEAARHLSPEFREAHPGVPWASVIGMRNKVVHDYMNLDDDILWETVTRELESLVRQLQEIGDSTSA